MKKINNGKVRMIWFFVLILAVCVSSTAIAFTSILNGFSVDDNGAIPLVPENLSISETEKTDTAESTSKNNSNVIADENPTATPPANSEENTEMPIPDVVTPQTPSNFTPGFEASDDNTVWSTETNVEIFRVSYVNGEQQITVNSIDGDKLIAPGTENSYIFKLKNTGNVPLEYSVRVEAYFEPAGITIPVTARLSRYDGKWIVGDSDAFASVPQLNTAVDSGTLGEGRFTYYTLDWQWPFETGNDERDTLLGNMAVDEDLTFTIKIITEAEADINNYDPGGILPPQTGDNSRIALWVTIAVSSLVIMVIIFIIDKKKKRAY